MSRLIDADALYEKTAEWEAQALHMAEVTMHDEDKTEWRKWSAVLAERSAFKYDIADAPTIDAVEVVRCKDCKFWQDQEEGVIEVPICARPDENKYEKLPFRFMIGKDGFCSFAERRSE